MKTALGDETWRAVCIALGSSILLGAVDLLDAPVIAVAAVGGVCVVLATVSPVGGLGAVILTLPWFFQPISVGVREFPGSELLLFAALGGLALRGAIESVRQRGRGAFSPSVVVARLASSRVWLVAWGLAGLGLLHLFALNERTNQGAAIREWRWTLLEPALLITAFTIAASRNWVRGFLAACLVGAMTGAALSGLSDLVSGEGVVADGVRRVSGPYPHPNALALFLVRGWSLTAAWWVLDPPRRRLLTIPLLIGGVGLVATFSRGAFAASALVVLLLAIVATRRFRLIALGALAAALGLVFAFAGARMAGAFDGGSASLRIDIWRSALAMIRDHPLWGYGPDGFLYSYAPRYVAPTAWPERFTAHAHNLLLDFWVRLGIIGAAAVVIGIGACLAKLAAYMRRRERFDTLSAVGLFGGCAAIVHGMVDNGYFSHDLAMSAWLLVWIAMERRNGVAGEDTVAVARPGSRRIGLHWLASLRQPAGRSP